MERKERKFYQQPLSVAKNYGTINVNDNRGRPQLPPAQTKTNPKSIRFDQETWDLVERIARVGRETPTDVINRGAEIATFFTKEQIETLIRYHNEIIPLIDLMGKS